MFYVAFEHIEGTHKGIRFWTGYNSEEEFNGLVVQPIFQVVAKGFDEEEIRAVALDYNPSLLVTVAERKREERRLKALAELEETGDKKKFRLALIDSEQLYKYEILSAKLLQRLG